MLMDHQNRKEEDFAVLVRMVGCENMFADQLTLANNRPRQLEAKFNDLARRSIYLTRRMQLPF